MSENGYVVYYSRTTLILGVFCSVFFAAVLIIMLKLPDGFVSWWVYPVLAAFLLLGVYMSVVSARWKIRVEDGAMQITPAFGKKKTIRFSDVTSVMSKGNVITVYSGRKKLFTLDITCINGDLLIKGLKRAER